jgi:hypothetical protein
MAHVSAGRAKRARKPRTRERAEEERAGAEQHVVRKHAPEQRGGGGRAVHGGQESAGGEWRSRGGPQGINADRG